MTVEDVESTIKREPLVPSKDNNSLRFSHIRILPQQLYFLSLHHMNELSAAVSIMVIERDNHKGRPHH